MKTVETDPRNLASNQVALLKETINQIMPFGRDAAAVFYSELFRRQPLARVFFRPDLVDAGQEMFALARMLVHGLEWQGALISVVECVGSFYKVYDLPGHYLDVCLESWLKMVQTCLGPAYTPAVEDAWRSAYVVLHGILDRTRPALGLDARGSAPRASVSLSGATGNGTVMSMRSKAIASALVMAAKNLPVRLQS